MSEVETSVEKHVFEADVAKLLHLMVHSVYSDKNVFLGADFERGRRLRKAALRSDVARSSSSDPLAHHSDARRGAMPGWSIEDPTASA